MKVILLCAGYATRLYPLTENQPKPLLPIGAKPLLEYLLEKLERVESIDQVFIMTNDRFYPNFKHWIQGKNYPWKIEIVNDGTQSHETRLGAIGDLALAIRKFQIQDDLGVFAGDNLFTFELPPFFSFARSHRPHASVGVIDIGNRDRARRYGIVCVNEERRVVEFLEKPAEPPSTLASTGIYWFAKESLSLLDRYKEESHNADQPGDYIRWLVQRDRVFAYPFEGKWFDIGDADSYEEAKRLFHSVKKIKLRKGFHEE